MHPAGLHLDEKQHVQPAQQHRVHREEITREDAAGLGVQELPPGEAGTMGRGTAPGGPQNRPDGASPRPDSRAERVHRGCDGSPTGDSPRRAGGSPQMWRAGPVAGAAGSSGGGPAGGASAESFPGGPAGSAVTCAGGAVPARPGSCGQPTRTGAGTPAVAAPRVRGVARGSRPPSPLSCGPPGPASRPVDGRRGRSAEPSRL